MSSPGILHFSEISTTEARRAGYKTRGRHRLPFVIGESVPPPSYRADKRVSHTQSGGNFGG